MSSLMGSHGVILAAAMAVSGTVLVLVLCRQRPTPPAASVVDEGAAAPPSVPSLRPCISGSRKSEGKAATKKQKKRVYFAEEVVELRAEGCNAEEKEEKREESLVPSEGKASPEISRVRCGWSACGRQVFGGMPANRLALYSGILRDRHLRMTCSY